MSAVMPADTTRSCTEPNQKGGQRAKGDPVGVAVLCGPSTNVVTDVVTGHSEEGHGDGPGDEGANCCEGGKE
jgi:hypothetical protein